MTKTTMPRQRLFSKRFGIRMQMKQSREGGECIDGADIPEIFIVSKVSERKNVIIQGLVNLCHVRSGAAKTLLSIA